MNSNEILRLTTARRHAKDGTGRGIRRAAALSMSEVADAVGVSLATVHRWELGQRRPTGQPALRWAALLEDLVRAGVC